MLLLQACRRDLVLQIGAEVDAHDLGKRLVAHGEAGVDEHLDGLDDGQADDQSLVGSAVCREARVDRNEHVVDDEKHVEVD